MNCIAQRRPKEIVIFVSTIIAVLPLINLIRGFFTQSLALDLLICYAPFMVLLLFLPNPYIAATISTISGRPWGEALKPAIPAFILALYVLIRSDGNYTYVIMYALAAVYLIAILSEFFDIQQIFNTILFVSCIASILVIVQLISYYLFGKYLQMVWLDICRYDIIKEYGTKIIDWHSMGSSLFRPSGIFLEPSQFAQYTAIGLADLLFSSRQIRNRYGMVILISLGLICSTSGLGVMVLTYEFILYAFIHMKDMSLEKKTLSIIAYCLLAVGIFAVLMQFNMFHLTIQRLFGQVDGYNAIAGRTDGWSYIKSMSATELLFGRGMASTGDLILWHSGSVSIIYTMGIIGATLFAVMIVWGMVKSNARSLCLGCYYLIICFFSATNVGVTVIFHVIIIYSGRLRVLQDT